MGRSADARARLEVVDALSSTSPAANLPSVPPRALRSRLPRRIRSPASTGAAARRSIPEAPLVSAEKERRNAGNAVARSAVSARRLAAEIWHLQMPELGDEGSTGRSREIESPAALPHSAMERATKWDSDCPSVPEKVYKLRSHLKLLEHKHATSVSVVSALQTELDQARERIIDLESERRSAKKKLDQLLMKNTEDTASWQRREHEKVRAIIEDMKADVIRERKTYHRMEVLNSKLVDELAKAKLSAKRFFQDYEKERRVREHVEEVFDELANEIGEDKAEAKALKAESLKFGEEVEKERKMLQMAEVWREERVQMKMIDAKVMLEAKYSQLRNLQSDLEEFLRDARSRILEVTKIREAESLIEAVSKANAQEIGDFASQSPLASHEILPVFEELQPGLPNGYGCSPESQASMLHAASPDTDCFLEKSTGRHAKDGNVEVESDWETISEIEEQESGNSPAGSEPSVNGICKQTNESVSETDWEERGVCRRSDSDVSEVFSATTRQSGRKVSSIVRLWRSAGSKNGEIRKNDEKNNGRRMSNDSFTSEGRSGEVGPSPRGIGQWSSLDSGNPRIIRKGFIEWPRGTQRHGSNSKLLDAKMDGEKVQLKQVLKQKI